MPSPNIFRSYKSAVSYRINKEHNDAGIWQRNDHEHIIRNECELKNIWNHIENNPSAWADDIGNQNKMDPAAI